MKKTLSCIVVVICIICTALVCGNMSTDSLIANETSVIYLSNAIDRISSRLVTSSFSSDSTGEGSSVNMNVSTGEWYTDMSGLQKGSCNVVDQLQGYSLYDSPTFNAEGNTFFFNIQKASMDMYDMFEGLGITPKISRDYLNDQWMNLERSTINWGGALVGNLTMNGEGRQCRVKDNMYMLPFAPMPCECSDTYYSSGLWTQIACYDSSELVNTYFNIVLVKQGEDVTNQSNWLYLPATPVDVKAHTYPWGLAQTNVTVATNTLVYGATSSSNRVYPYTNNNLGDTDFIKRVVSDMDTHSATTTGMIWDRCEASGVHVSDWNHAYDIVGCITYNGVRR